MTPRMPVAFSLYICVVRQLMSIRWPSRQQFDVRLFVFVDLLMSGLEAELQFCIGRQRARGGMPSGPPLFFYRSLFGPARCQAELVHMMQYRNVCRRTSRRHGLLGACVYVCTSPGVWPR